MYCIGHVLSDYNLYFTVQIIFCQAIIYICTLLPKMIIDALAANKPRDYKSPKEKEPPDQPPGTMNEKKRRVPGAVDQIWASLGPTIQVQSWLLMISPGPANPSSPMCGSTPSKPGRRTWDPGGTCHWSLDGYWTTDQGHGQKATSGRSDDLYLVVNLSDVNHAIDVNDRPGGRRSPVTCLTDLP